MRKFGIIFNLILFSTGSSINSHLATIMIGLVQLVSNLAALFVVDKSGRKPLLMISAVLMCISMGSMGTAFYLKNHGNEQFGYVWQNKLTPNHFPWKRVNNVKCGCNIDGYRSQVWLFT